MELDYVNDIFRSKFSDSFDFYQCLFLYIILIIMDGHLFLLSNDKSMSHTGLWEYCRLIKSLHELLKSHEKFSCTVSLCVVVVCVGGGLNLSPVVMKEFVHIYLSHEKYAIFKIPSTLVWVLCWLIFKFNRNF